MAASSDKASTPSHPHFTILPPPPADKNTHMVAREGRGPKWKYLAPLLYIPLIPTSYILLRKKPDVHNRVVGLTILAALIHGSYLLLFDLDLMNADPRR